MEISRIFNEWLAASVRMAAPLILVGIGGVFNERVGVFNIGLEGMMLAGTLAAVAGDLFTGSPWIGTLCAMAAGGLLAVIHAYLTVTRRANQIVSGAAINLFALGITNLLMGPLYAGYTYRPRVPLYPKVFPPVLRGLPILGPALFDQPVMIWITFALALIASWVLYHTTWGLNIRAVGDHPHAVAAAGISVFRLKYIGVILSGIFAGLSGSALTLTELGLFAPNMTRGRGFIGMAALAVGNWDPIRVAVTCLAFGAADALQFRAQTWSQTYNITIPYQFLVMVPYLLTIAALAGIVGRTHPPKTVGKPYEPEKF